MTADPTFFAIELECYRPGASTLTVDEGHGTHPHGALSQLATPIESTATIYASDMGYRTAPTDPGGPIPYPPLLADAFSIAVALNLDPTQSAAGAAWGSMSLANPNGQWDSIAASWNSDSRPITIRYGQKAFEGFDGYRTKRGTIGTYIDAAGVMQTAAAGVVRWDYSTGSAVALNEPAATNYIRNPRAEGAVVGTPGTLPTNWQFQQTGGLSTSVVGTGVEKGIPYVDIRFSGTVATGFYGAIWADSGLTAATSGQTWTASIYGRIAAGSLANVNASGFLLDIEEADASGSQIQDDAATIATQTVIEPFTRYAVTKTLSNAACASIRARVWQFGFNAGAIDITFRLGVPQLERSSSATSVILPSAGAPAVTTRAADLLYTARGIYLDPQIADLAVAFAGLASAWQLSETALTVPLRDATAWIERNYQQNTYGGTGGLDGTADMAGKPIPRTRGGTAGSPVRNITPTLIDPVNLIYQWNDGPGTLVALYEGAALTITFASDTTDLYSGTTPPGQYRTDVARGLFQLGSVPAQGLAITCDVTGSFPIAGAVTTPAGIARYMLAEDMAVPAANIDVASFDAIASAYPYVAGLYFGSDGVATGVAAISAILAGWGAQLVPARDGTLRLIVLRALAASDTPVATFSTDNLVSLTPHQLPAVLDPPPSRIQVGHSHNYTVQTTGLNTTTATAAQQQFVATSDSFASWFSATIAAAYRRPNALTLPSPLLSQSDAQAVANDLGALWGTRRRLYDGVLPAAVAVAREMGDRVTTVFPMEDLRSGRLGQIVGYSFHSTDPTIAVQVLI